MHSIEEQIRLEEDTMIQRGIESYRKQIADAQQHGSESRTLYGVTLMKHAVGSVTDALRDFVIEAHQGKAGRLNQAAEGLVMIDPEVAAYLALKVMIDGLTNELSLSNVGMTIGKAIEDEIKFRAAANQDPQFFQKEVLKATRKTSNRHYRRYNLMRAMSFREIDHQVLWSKQDRAHVGMKMVDLVITSTGLFQIRTQTIARLKTQHMLSATPQTLEWVERLNLRGEMMNPQYLPCLVPPRDWVAPQDGGYYSEKMCSLPMVKTHNRNLLEELPTYSETIESEYFYAA